MSFCNKVSQHRFGDFEISDNSILHGSDGHDVAGSSSEHFLGSGSNSDDLLFAFVVLFYGYDRGLIRDHPFTLDINQGVGRPEVNSQVIAEEVSEHAVYANRLN